jgi:hypothetical protein
MFGSHLLLVLNPESPGMSEGTKDLTRIIPVTPNVCFVFVLLSATQKRK